MNTLEFMKDVIDKFYSKYTAVISEVENILISCGASEDDSKEDGYFSGMTYSQIKECYNKIRDLIKYYHENIDPDYFTEDTLIDFDLRELIVNENLSVYRLMNKIDDNESLNEKYEVNRYKVQRTSNDVDKLQESAMTPSDRSSIKSRVNELINMVDWSKWKKFTSTGDDTKPEVKKTKAVDDGIRVYVYLGWDYGHNDDMEEYVKSVNEKFDAFAAVVRKEEPSWSVKLVKSYGSRGVTWTNYWAQVTAKNSITEATSVVDGKRRALSAEVAQYVENKQRESGMPVDVADHSGYWNTRTVNWKMNNSETELFVTVTVFYNASALSVRVMDTDGKVVSQNEGISLEDTKAIIDQLFQD